MRVFVIEKLTNGNAESSTQAAEEHSVYYDATESRPNNASKPLVASAVSPTVSSNVPLRVNKAYRDKEATGRPHSVHSKIPVPVKSPRCSLSESTPETNTRNGTGSSDAHSKDKDTS